MIHSTEILKLLARQEDSYLLDELGAPHRDDLKRRTVTMRTTNGNDIAILDNGGQILDDFIRASLVYEAVPLDEKYRRIYRLTSDGLERAKAA